MRKEVVVDQKEQSALVLWVMGRSNIKNTHILFEKALKHKGMHNIPERENEAKLLHDKYTKDRSGCYPQVVLDYCDSKKKELESPTVKIVNIATRRGDKKIIDINRGRKR